MQGTSACARGPADLENGSRKGGSGTDCIAGCSHPGIVNVLQRAKQQRNKEIYWVLGGFHLIDSNANDLPVSQITPVVDAVKNLGVKKISATHCTGNLAISLFQAAFGNDYVPAGTGRVIPVSP